MHVSDNLCTSEAERPCMRAVSCRVCPNFGFEGGLDIARAEVVFVLWKEKGCGRPLAVALVTCEEFLSTASRFTCLMQCFVRDSLEIILDSSKWIRMRTENF